MDVTLYFDEGCFDCVIAKTYLETMNIEFEAKNLKEDKNKLELVEKVHKYVAPVLIIDDDVYIGFGSIDGKFIANAPEILERLGILPAAKDENGEIIKVAPKIIKTLDIAE